MKRKCDRYIKADKEREKSIGFTPNYYDETCRTCRPKWDGCEMERERPVCYIQKPRERPKGYHFDYLEYAWCHRCVKLGDECPTPYYNVDMSKC